MLKKFIFVLVLGVCAFASVSAQTKVDKFIGTWKLVDQPKPSVYKSIVLNVSIDGDALKVEKTSERNNAGKYTSGTVISSYKLNGATSTVLLPRQNDFASIYLRGLSDDKLRFVQNYRYDDFRQESFNNTSTREDWILSSDGKRLTVEMQGYRTSVRFVYEKQ